MHTHKHNETIAACRMCLMCRHACTVGNVTQRDTNLPRGKALMLFAAQMQLLDWDERALQVVYECTNCHVCREWCVKGWDIAPVMMAARADIVEMGLTPEQATRIRDNIEKAGNPYGEEKSQLIDRPETTPRPETADVLYFIGCTASYRRPEVAESAVALLERCGTEFTILDNEPCCGEPLYVMGFRNEAKARAERTLERIQAAGARTVVSSCPTGIDTFRHGYREWGVEMPDGIRFLHISEYIAEQIEAGRLQMSRPLNVSLTYHDPCSLGREMQVYEAPRQVLSAVPGTELREMRLNRGHSPCCGNGGGVPATNSNIAHGAGKNAGDVILETGAQVLITACPSCKQSLMHHVPGMEVLDIAELVGRAL